jgi:hypothetical protein
LTTPHGEFQPVGIAAFHLLHSFKVHIIHQCPIEIGLPGTFCKHCSPGLCAKPPQLKPLLCSGKNPAGKGTAKVNEHPVQLGLAVGVARPAGRARARRGWYVPEWAPFEFNSTPVEEVLSLDATLLCETRRGLGGGYLAKSLFQFGNAPLKEVLRVSL